jgi:uncharacterized protein (DUF58 family)
MNVGKAAQPFGSRRASGSADQRPFELESEAHGLADRLPELTVEALRIASTIAFGLHGRRRPGPGETFWQFRQLQSTDSVTMIDWRRSASTDQLFVREREWEAAHTIWLWPDLSPSMAFNSHLSRVTKRDRVLVLTLALAELLVRGGERVGILGLTRPTSSRKATTKLAEAIAAHARDILLAGSLPPPERVGRFNGVVLLGDFLDPVPGTADRIRTIAGEHVSGHMIQVLDPAEESLPYDGRTEFLGLEGADRWVADRAEGIRETYRARFAAHRAELREMARPLGWSFLVHHTDKPAAEPLLSLVQRLGSARGPKGGAA